MQDDRDVSPLRDPDRATAQKPKLPPVSVTLMAVFLVGGSLALAFKWPPGPANLDWGVWVVCYFGYLFVIGACLYHVKTGR